MSYLGPLRLHFAGRFQAAPSTVNNDPTHFDNAAFVPSFQKLQGPHMHPANGWWNPRGDAVWRLIGCRVTSAFTADGSPAPLDDPVRQMLIADSDRAAPAKLVDLDPLQQLVSTIFGLEVRIADGAGNTRARGAYEPAPFFDIWDRAAAGGGDVIAGAYYQSVLTGTEWSGVSDSPFLAALRDASPDGVLSIKFMVDGYNMTFGDPEFTRGRIVGTIGPGAAAEPAHLVRGRQFAASQAPGGAFFVPAGGVNFCTAVVDEATAKIYLDLGNALPTWTAGGEIKSLGELSLHAGDEPLCPVPYESREWYEQTAGIVALPADRQLDAAELERIADEPLSLCCAGEDAPAVVEAEVYVRADQLVFRCDPGTDAGVRLYATKFGRPYAGATVHLERDAGGLQSQTTPSWPEVAVPAGALSFPATATTDADGVADVTIAISDPGWPRRYIDGQVYGVRASLADDPGAPVDPWNFVSLLVWSHFHADDPVTWHGSLQPVFQQYANLYPIMQDFLDLSSYEDVCAKQELLLLAFGLDPDDPNSMPVTRDLSVGKRDAILRWLREPGPDGKPRLGEARPAAAHAASAAVSEPVGDESARGGGKAAAAARRISVQSRRR
jgi:hypothetical protein